MRALILLLAACFVTACAGRPLHVSKSDCSVSEGNVAVGMNGAGWSRFLEADPEPVPNPTFIRARAHLFYVLNLDPDSTVNQRAYTGLADHADLLVSYELLYPRPDGLDSYTVELRGEALAIARPLDPSAYQQLAVDPDVPGAHFSGADLDHLLGGASDIDILLRDPQGQIVRRDHIVRTELDQVDASIRRLSTRLAPLLADPVRFCQPDEIII